MKKTLKISGKEITISEDVYQYVKNHKDFEKEDLVRGVIIYNEKGEHYLLAVETDQQCCECCGFDSITYGSQLPIEYKGSKGYEPEFELMIEIDENSELIPFLEDVGQGRLISIRVYHKVAPDNAIYFGWAFNVQNGYYGHTVLLKDDKYVHEEII